MSYKQLITSYVLHSQYNPYVCFYWSFINNVYLHSWHIHLLAMNSRFIHDPHIIIVQTENMFQIYSIINFDIKRSINFKEWILVGLLPMNPVGNKLHLIHGLSNFDIRLPCKSSFYVWTEKYRIKLEIHTRFREKNTRFSHRLIPHFGESNTGISHGFIPHFGRTIPNLLIDFLILTEQYRIYS